MLTKAGDSANKARLLCRRAVKARAVQRARWSRPAAQRSFDAGGYAVSAREDGTWSVSHGGAAVAEGQAGSQRKAMVAARAAAHAKAMTWSGPE